MYVTSEYAEWAEVECQLNANVQLMDEAKLVFLSF